MASIFTPCELGVLRVNNSCATPKRAVIAVDDYSIELPITGFTLDLGTNHQFLHTLDEFIYVYAFGDRIGELTLSGVAFIGDARQEGSCADLSDVLGANSLLQHYLARRIGIGEQGGGPASTLILIDAAQDSGVLTGFLTGVRMDVPNPALPIVQWVLRYNVIINANGAGTGGGGAGGTTGGGGGGTTVGTGGGGGGTTGPGGGIVATGRRILQDFLDVIDSDF
jgi:hypothetical protein